MLDVDPGPASAGLHGAPLQGADQPGPDPQTLQHVVHGQHPDQPGSGLRSQVDRAHPGESAVAPERPPPARPRPRTRPASPPPRRRRCSGPPDQSRSARSDGSRSRTVSRSFMSDSRYGVDRDPLRDHRGRRDRGGHRRPPGPGGPCRWCWSPAASTSPTLRERGLRLRTPEEDVTVLPVPAVCRPERADADRPTTCWCWPPRPSRPWRAGRVGRRPGHSDGQGTAGEQLPIFVADQRRGGRGRWPPLLPPGLRGLRLDVGRAPDPGRGDHRRDSAHGHAALGRVPRPARRPMISDCWRRRPRTGGPPASSALLPADVMAVEVPQADQQRRQRVPGPARPATAGMRPAGRAAEAEARAVLDAAGIVYTTDEDEAAARADGFTVQPVPGVPEFARRVDLAVADPRHRQRRDRLPQRRDRPDRRTGRSRGADQRPAGLTWSARPPRQRGPARRYERRRVGRARGLGQ